MNLFFHDVGNEQEGRREEGRRAKWRLKALKLAAMRAVKMEKSRGTFEMRMSCSKGQRMKGRWQVGLADEQISDRSYGE